jgi:hypothetical protein
MARTIRIATAIFPVPFLRNSAIAGNSKTLSPEIIMAIVSALWFFRHICGSLIRDATAYF